MDNSSKSRFLSLRRRNPTSWNRYGYTSGDPVNGSDASGTCLANYSGICNNSGCPAWATCSAPLPTNFGDIDQAETNYVTGTVVPAYLLSALNNNPVITYALLPTGAVSATIAYGQEQQESAVISALLAPPEMFYAGFINMLLNDDPKGALQVAGSLALAVGPQAVAGALAPATLYHFTSYEAAAAIGESGVIYPNFGLGGWGAYGSAFNSSLSAQLMGAGATDIAIPFSSGMGAAPVGIGPFIIPGSYVVNAPVTLFGGVPVLTNPFNDLHAY